MLKGMAASAGIGIGKAVLVQQNEAIVKRRSVDDPRAEVVRLKMAIDQFCEETLQFCESVSRNIGEAESRILSVQIAIVRDPDLMEQLVAKIEGNGVNAEYAFASVCDSYIDLFSSMEEDLVRARAADLFDIKNRMLHIMMGIKPLNISELPSGSILVAEDISPSLAVDINPERVSGIVTQMGTSYSHISIIARALRLPAVVALSNLLENVKDGDNLIIDGAEGVVVRNPDKGMASTYQARKNLICREIKKLDSFRGRSTVTIDGKKISLAANLAIMPELFHIKEGSADGIGLFRTEFLYMDSNSLPGEEQQYRTYKSILETMGDKPVVIRTLDVGGDKKLSYMPMPKEANPYLGYRAVRFSLNRTGIFKTQLSALLRAGMYGNLKIMIPMVTSLSELWQVKDILQSVQVDLRMRGESFREDIPLGMMVETPAAAMCADMFAREVDFFSIGTNDLTQYTLAVDRNNENVSGIYSTLHPAVLRLIRYTVKSANEAGIPVCVCGEAASDPLLIPFFIGVGVNELSVSAGALLTVRRQISKTSYAFWRDHIDGLLNLRTAQEVASAVQGML